MYTNNGYGYQYNYPQNMPQRFQITRVNGIDEVNKFQMLPNSETILLDTTAPLVWLVQTDNVGNKTNTPFTITPYTPPKPVDVNDLMAKIKELEDRLDAQSNVRNAEQGNIAEHDKLSGTSKANV